MQALLLVLSLLVAAPAAEGYVSADDGTRLFYRIEGRGPETLVVVHGGPGNSLESVRADLAPLARHRRVIYYDQRGNGRSDLIDAPERLAIAHHIADLDAVRRHFGLGRMTLLGNSWGGLLVSFYAAAHPDRVERMILHAPGPPTRGYLRLMNDIVHQRARQRLTPAQRSRYAELWQPSFWLASPDPLATCDAFFAGIFRIYRFDPDATLPFRGNVCAGPPQAVRRQLWVNATILQSLGDFDLRAAVGRVTAPMLVIYGATDVVPLSGVEAWASSYADGRLLVIERAGHLVHVERPDAFFPAVETFLAGRWPEGAVRPASQAPSSAASRSP
jgi:proline iminopeptidase